MKYQDISRNDLIKRIEDLEQQLSAHKAIESAYRETQQRLTDIIDFLPDATFAVDLQGKVLLWNKSMELMTGVKAEAILGKGDYEYSLPFYGERRPILIDLVFTPQWEIREKYEFVTTVEEAILAEANVNLRKRGIRHLWGKASPLYNADGELVGAIESIRDITAQKTAEHERNELMVNLQRAEKMEALGNLAGGVAHDLNNILGVIVGYSELLLQEPSFPHCDNVVRRLTSILKSSTRAAAIVEDLLTLARRGVIVKEVVDLNKVVCNLLNSPEIFELKKQHPHVRWHCSLQSELKGIEGSPVHFEKSLFNLCCNGVESIQEAGELHISTAMRCLDAPLDGYDDIVPANYVVLTVTDTGDGIAPEDRPHIFEPFYTKKNMGSSGTGLGLAVVWGTVQDHKGYITVQSKKGEGTSFSLYIPTTAKKVTERHQEGGLFSYEGRDTENILLVDDVLEQRNMAADLLTMLNYTVFHVGSGEEAIEFLQSKQVDLVVLDMIMDPGMDGLDTYMEIRKINPGQKVLIVSGYAETDRVLRLQKLGGGQYIKKPYTLHRFGKAVREELDKGKEKEKEE